MTAATVPTKGKIVIANTRTVLKRSSPVRTSNVSGCSIVATVKTIVVILQMKWDAVSFFLIGFLILECLSWNFCLSLEKDNNTCSSLDQFRCNNGQCIDAQRVCNKEIDCSDESDEPLHCNVDECAKTEIHQCGHKCVNTLTGYYCECNQGYKLVKIMKSSKLVSVTPFLFISDY